MKAEEEGRQAQMYFGRWTGFPEFLATFPSKLLLIVQNHRITGETRRQKIKNLRRSLLWLARISPFVIFTRRVKKNTVAVRRASEKLPGANTESNTGDWRNLSSSPATRPSSQPQTNEVIDTRRPVTPVSNRSVPFTNDNNSQQSPEEPRGGSPSASNPSTHDANMARISTPISNQSVYFANDNSRRSLKEPRGGSLSTSDSTDASMVEMGAPELGFADGRGNPQIQQTLDDNANLQANSSESYSQTSDMIHQPEASRRDTTDIDQQMTNLDILANVAGNYFRSEAPTLNLPQMSPSLLDPQLPGASSLISALPADHLRVYDGSRTSFLETYQTAGFNEMNIHTPEPDNRLNPEIVLNNNHFGTPTTADTILEQPSDQSGSNFHDPLPGAAFNIPRYRQNIDFQNSQVETFNPAAYGQNANFENPMTFNPAAYGQNANSENPTTFNPAAYGQNTNSENLTTFNPAAYGQNTNSENPTAFNPAAYGQNMGFRNPQLDTFNPAAYGQNANLQNPTTETFNPSNYGQRSGVTEKQSIEILSRSPSGAMLLDN
ncbi:hypothetical protein ACJ73_08048 [Blastomyces percursus]|uniref:Uncharacterized protein n=1 Tax=Blastomyces percursus TaxID=1658174 RepID=A0A1J9PW78_9EURO|nr:hypothetical protein ACJ73_08048 [Blastomyces percursus]